MLSSGTAGETRAKRNGTSLRIGVVGLGPWGVEHLRAWRQVPGVSVVAVCDRDRARGEAVAAEHDVSRCFVSALEMADAELDIVSIASGESDRAEVAAPFLERGVHALIEKPLALDLPAAARLLRIAEQHDVTVMTGHILRFDPRFAALKQRLVEGSLGDLRSVYARRLNLRSAHARYARTHPALMAAIHDFDLACWYFGSMPQSVRVNCAAPAVDSPFPDLLWTVLEFPGGRLAVVENAWVLPDDAGVWLESETELIGTEGVARLRTPSDGLELLGAEGPERLDPSVASLGPGDAATALRETLLYLAECVRSGRPPERLRPAESLRSLAVALTAVRAAESGRQERLDVLDIPAEWHDQILA
ncbi:MAG: dehydrogenase [Solirubrobacterales bacterium]|nr:dehydrogenase [Solirubrobacterales bacterium]